MKPIYDLAIRKVTAQIQNSAEWIAALKISTQLRIRELREIAIQKLAGHLTSTLQQIEIGIEYKIQSFLLDGYTEFVTRDEVISVEDEAQLGWSRTSKLFRVRHRLLQNPYDIDDVRSDLENTFAEEFAAAECAIDWSLISHLQPEFHTVTDTNAIQWDKEYYCTDVIFSVR